MAEVICRVEAKNILGEGPLWNPREQALYWCDIRKPAIQRLDPATSEIRVWEMPEEIGSFVFRETGGIIAALKIGYHSFDPETGTLNRIVDPEPEQPETRMNDGKCDRRGRYWCGSMDMAIEQPLGALYQLDPDLTCHRMADGITVTNGIAFSPDDKVMYYADSRADMVYAHDFDIDSGEIRNRRVFISTHDLPGRVDGATVDAEGYYWCAHTVTGRSPATILRDGWIGPFVCRSAIRPCAPSAVRTWTGSMSPQATGFCSRGRPRPSRLPAPCSRFGTSAPAACPSRSSPAERVLGATPPSHNLRDPEVSGVIN